MLMKTPGQGLSTRRLGVAPALALALFLAGGLPAFAQTQLKFVTKNVPDGTLGLAYKTRLQATGGTAPYQFKWFVWNGATWTVVQNWSTTNTFAWTPTTSNANYIVNVWVRNATTTADTWDAYATLSFPIQ